MKMDKGLQEVIDKLKASKPNIQQTSKPIEKPVEIPQAEIGDDIDDVDDEEFYEDTEKKVEQQSPQQVIPNKAEIEMELLNNNGRFRAELLYQLQELNKAMVVIAQVLMNKK